MRFLLWFAFSQLLLVVVPALLPKNAHRHRSAKRVKFEPPTQKPCFQPGMCVELSECTVFKDQALHLTPKNAEFLKSKSCGFSGSTPLVCCPVVNVDPDKVVCGEGGFALTRVVGGANADLADWPWAVAIFVDEEDGTPELSCGGTLINPNFILTAAHCVVSQSLGGKQIDSNKFSVRLGDLDLNNHSDEAFPVTKRVSKAIAHPHFKLSTFHNDIALLQLESPVQYTTQIKPVCFPGHHHRTKTYEREGAVLVGWGTIGFDKEASAHLQYVQIPVQPQDVCIKSYSPFRSSHPIIPSQMCAGLLSGKKDACQGDSGGPLTVFDTDLNGWVLVGVVSYGLRCAEPGFPGIYTRVTSFLDWVDEHTKL